MEERHIHICIYIDIYMSDGQPPTIAFTVLPQLCGPKATEAEMGATLFTKNGEGRNFDF